MDPALRQAAAITQGWSAAVKNLQQGTRRGRGAQVARRKDRRLEAGGRQGREEDRSPRTWISHDRDHARGLRLQEIEQAAKLTLAIKNWDVWGRQRQEIPHRLRRRDLAGRRNVLAGWLCFRKRCGLGQSRRCPTWRRLLLFARKSALVQSARPGEHAHDNPSQLGGVGTTKPQGLRSCPAAAQKRQQQVERIGLLCRKSEGDFLTGLGDGCWIHAIIGTNFAGQDLNRGRGDAPLGEQAGRGTASVKHSK